MTSRKASGFTIVELLVVITIIGILMALIFPAINAARGAANKADCINNQSQIGKAILTATTKRGDFPKHLNDKGGNKWPWAANVMRELGRGDIADQMLTTSPSAVDSRIDLLICAADAPVDQATLQTNYSANTGIAGLDDKIADGVFHQTNDVSLAYVATNDGAATTLLVAENVDATNWNDAATTAPEVYQSGLIFKASAGAGCGLNENTGSCTGEDLARPRSNHSGGFVATFCDGHVQFLSKEIGYEVYQLLMTPNGKAATTKQNTVLNEAHLDK